MGDAPARRLIVAATLAAYVTAFLGTFQLDDWLVVVRDPRVQDLGAWWRSMPGIRPLLKLTYALDHASGLGLAAFHLVNVTIHVMSALLVHRLLVRLGTRHGEDASRVRWAALLGALLFALHPAQTEAVTYVSGRSSALSGMLVLASVVVWLRELDGESRWPSRVASVLLFAAAVGAKETALFLPGALLLLAATDPRAGRSWRGVLAAIAPHLAAAAVLSLALVASTTYRRMLSESFALRDPASNLAAQLAATGWLAGQVIRPDRLNADPDLGPLLHLDGVIAAIAVALVAVVGAGLLLVRRKPALAFGLLWFVLWLAPSGWLVPRAEPASDRQLYVALLGPAWLVGRALATGLATRGTIARWTVVALVVAGAGTLTAARNLVYRDEVRFWSDVVAKSPHNARARNNLAVALAVACRRAEAEAELLRALDRDPHHVRAAVNLRLLREGAPLDARAPRCD